MAAANELVRRRRHPFTMDADDNGPFDAVHPVLFGFIDRNTASHLKFRTYIHGEIFAGERFKSQVAGLEAFGKSDFGRMYLTQPPSRTMEIWFIYQHDPRTPETSRSFKRHTLHDKKGLTFGHIAGGDQAAECWAESSRRGDPLDVSGHGRF